MSKEAMKLALGKVKSARNCHPNAVDTLLFEAEEVLEEALNAPLAEQKSGIKQVIELYDSPEQPAQQQEPVAWINWCASTGKRSVSFECESELASQPLYEGITQNTQYHYSKFHSWFDSELHRQKYTQDHPAYLAAQEAWNAANDAAQYRINRLNAEIEAWKVRFKIAEDALAKLNGPEQEPVEYWTVADGWVSEQAEVPAFVWVEPDFWEHCKRVNCGTAYRLPAPGRQLLYTSPPASKPWVGLTDEEKADLFEGTAPYYNETDYADAIEAKLKEKNNGN